MAMGLGSLTGIAVGFGVECLKDPIAHTAAAMNVLAGVRVFYPNAYLWQPSQRRLVRSV